ncbi:hypothetical protein QFZ97_000592 [Paraburkholderia youngii]
MTIFQVRELDEWIAKKAAAGAASRSAQIKKVHAHRAKYGSGHGTAGAEK